MIDRNTQGGFSLVELGITVLVIGLLLGVVLKAAEVMGNARIISTINQITDINAASAVFQNKYRALPGDIINPAETIPNCTSEQCRITGNGDGFLDLSQDDKESVAWSVANESRNYWLHLAAADMLRGVQSAYEGTPNKYGVDFPQSPLGGGWQVQSFREGNARRTYMTLLRMMRAPNDAQARYLTPAQIYQIDLKIDDGMANRGFIRGYSEATQGVCTEEGTSDSNHNTYHSEDKESDMCNLWVVMTRHM